MARPDHLSGKGKTDEAGDADGADETGELDETDDAVSRKNEFLHRFCNGTSVTKNLHTMKTIFFGLCCFGALALMQQYVMACSRAVYLGPDGMTVTGRTMDWAEDMHTNLYLFPRGIARRGANTNNTVFWTSKYGSVAATGYDIGVSEGMNEAGLVANLLFLPESVYDRPGRDNRPVMGMSIWTQYVLDNFATVAEAVAELSKQTFRIDAPDLPGGKQSRLHMAISDASGDSAILEYIDGELNIHHGRQYRVLTNSPIYPQQLAVNDYWQQIGGLVMLPGTNRSSDRFVRASFYIDASAQSADPKIAVPTVFSVMHNVAVPYGITTPDKPHISSTQWISVSDQKNKIYYFEPTLDMQVFWVDLTRVDFSQGTPERVLQMAGSGRTFVGDVTAQFRPAAKPFKFLLEV